MRAHRPRLYRRCRLSSQSKYNQRHVASRVAGLDYDEAYGYLQYDKPTPSPAKDMRLKLFPLAVSSDRTDSIVRSDEAVLTPPKKTVYALKEGLLRGYLVKELLTSKIAFT
jgi:hypothetical protein